MNRVTICHYVNQCCYLNHVQHAYIFFQERTCENVVSKMFAIFQATVFWSLCCWKRNIWDEWVNAMAVDSLTRIISMPGHQKLSTTCNVMLFSIIVILNNLRHLSWPYTSEIRYVLCDAGPVRAEMLRQTFKSRSKSAHHCLRSYYSGIEITSWRR